jgi:hypothetical protein
MEVARLRASATAAVVRRDCPGSLASPGHTDRREEEQRCGTHYRRHMLMRLVASSPLTLLRTGAAASASRAAPLPAAASSLLRGARVGGARCTGGGGGGLPAAAPQHVCAVMRTGHAPGQGQARRMSIARAVTTKEEPDTVGDAFLADGDFESLGCSTELADALRGSGFRRPTTVQVRDRPCVWRTPD